jgi:hypothetical protein
VDANGTAGGASGTTKVVMSIDLVEIRRLGATNSEAGMTSTGEVVTRSTEAGTVGDRARQDTDITNKNHTAGEASVRTDDLGATAIWTSQGVTVQMCLTYKLFWSRT